MRESRGRGCCHSGSGATIHESPATVRWRNRSRELQQRCPTGVTVAGRVRTHKCNNARAMPNTYDAPLKHIRSSIDLAAEVTGLRALPGMSPDMSPKMSELLGDVTDSVLEGASKFAREVLSPLNPTGDRVPAQCTAEG